MISRLYQDDTKNEKEQEFLTQTPKNIQQVYRNGICIEKLNVDD